MNGGSLPLMGEGKSAHRKDSRKDGDVRSVWSKWLQICWIALFGGFLTTPLALMIVMPETTVSHTENRTLATFPQLQGHPLREVLKDIEVYWNDHFGLREPLVFLYNWMCWKGFEQSGVPWVTVGQNDWFFYAGDQSNEDILGRVNLDDSDLKWWAAILQAKKNWLERQGIRYVFVLVPNKQSIYPEYLPTEIQRHAVGVRRIDRLLEVLRRNTDVDIIDVRDALLKEKQRNPVFYRTDSHWNRQGAYAAYAQLMKTPQVWFPEMHPLETSQLTDIKRAFRHGDLRMGLDGVLWEEERVWMPQKPCSRLSDMPFDRYLFRKGCNDARRRAIVLRDSFLDYIEPYLSEHFLDVVYIWKRWDEASGTEHRLYKEWIDRIHPDIVIEERVERLIGRIPMATSDQRFDYAGSSLVRFDDRNGFHGIFSCHQTRLEAGFDGLIMHATDIDPSICFSEIDIPKGPLILRIVIESPIDTVLQMYFKSAEENDYCEEKSRKSLLKQGINTVFLSLDDRVAEGVFRLDPGSVPGAYRLLSLEIRRDEVESLLRDGFNGDRPSFGSIPFQ